ncbi:MULTISPECIES: AraC family transcriptional regulator [Chryseobacterium]|jgi:AraC-like DNA-binding protein|uniref:AraC-like DNA-binding protein n=1 Tax=Chryseobacterium geocarposphaerae TaxID=1416776 RepID=A0ABU1L9H4_9FLAO|nr:MULTISPECIES: AraC family transcriptional regulator [Chryseobacterium]MDR6403369.1 AraC-like DNA-binding protein [Chryseobacterium geocarposphaerae]MDR6696923.1 AraC-like DNA-binding protein [Chryseobacterium ginsenosidimutans]
MSVLEKFGVEIFTQHNIFERIAVDKPFRPENPAFIFIKTGTIKLRQHFNDLELSANMFMVTDPQTVYEMISVSDDFQSRMVSYKREFISALSLRFNRLIGYRYFRQQMNRGVPFEPDEMELVWKSVNFLKYILDTETEILYKKEVVEHLFSVFCYQMAGIISKEDANSMSQMSRQEEIVFIFLNDLAANHNTERTVEFYAERQSITTRHLSSVVKTITGKSASQIIALIVMNEAKVLLNSSNKPVSEISSILGFSDQYSFSHFFKKHSGESPSQYRNQFES